MELHHTTYKEYTNDNNPNTAEIEPHTPPSNIRNIAHDELITPHQRQIAQ